MEYDLIIDLLMEKYSYELNHLAIHGSEDSRTLEEYYYRRIYMYLAGFYDRVSTIENMIDELIERTLNKIGRSSELEALHELLEDVEEL